MFYECHKILSQKLLWDGCQQEKVIEVVQRLHEEETELSDMGLTMGEAQVIAQDRHRWRRDIVALCPTLGWRG